MFNALKTFVTALFPKEKTAVWSAAEWELAGHMYLDSGEKVDLGGFDPRQLKRELIEIEKLSDYLDVIAICNNKLKEFASWQDAQQDALVRVMATKAFVSVLTAFEHRTEALGADMAERRARLARDKAMWQDSCERNEEFRARKQREWNMIEHGHF